MVEKVYEEIQEETCYACSIKLWIIGSVKRPFEFLLSICHFLPLPNRESLQFLQLSLNLQMSIPLPIKQKKLERNPTKTFFFLEAGAFNLSLFFSRPAVDDIAKECFHVISL